MAKQPRLHEVSKALGLSSKVLMADLSSEGFDFKTHMATLDESALAAIRKKYPRLDNALAEAEKKAAEEPAEKKPKAPRGKKSSKMITSRTAAKKSAAAIEKEAESSNDLTPKVEFVRQASGETVEQKVISGGVIRRRRVEEGSPPSAPTTVTTSESEVSFSTHASSSQSAPEFEPQPEAPDTMAREPVRTEAPKVVRRSVRVVEATPAEEVIARHEAQRAAAQAAEAAARAAAQEKEKLTKSLVESEEKTPNIEVPDSASSAEVSSSETTSRPSAPAPSVPTTSSSQFVPAPKLGRDLSAPRRLKVVAESSGPVPPIRKYEPRPLPDRAKVGAEAAKPKVGVAVRAPKTPEAEAEEAARAPKVAVEKKAAAKNWEAPRVTKRDLMGMTEEFEISRPLGGRKGRKAQARIEKKTKMTVPSEKKRKIKIESEIRVSDLADRMGVKAADVVRKLIGMGQMVGAHQAIDYDTAVLIASEYEYEVENVAETAESVLEAHLSEEQGELHNRPPVVTIMGHVDHGKTSLLDYIRRSRVAEAEAGGITQHIGAYQVEKNGKKVTFLDTPGHQAFTKMRARGASVTDIVILVVAADEGIKAQTLEAIAHAKAAKVPIIVAVNKIDKPEAQPDRVMQELSGQELVPEEWGGDTMFVKVSAKKGTGVEDLLESILLQAEVLNLKAPVKVSAKGVVLESRLDKGKGPVATVLVTRGHLDVGSPIVAGRSFGRVRAMLDDAGKPIETAGPSTPVEVLGFSLVPEAGDTVTSVTEDSIARRASDLSTLAKRAEDSRKAGRISLEDMYRKMQTGDIHELRVILKGDVQGSVEAIADALEKIKHEEVRVSIVYKAVGGITESDVSLAAASGAIVLGFNVRPAGQAKQMAASEGVQIKAYSIIYELIDEVKQGMQGLLAPDIKESVLGQAEVRDVFNLTKFGIVAGCFIRSGKILRGQPARLIRDNVVVYQSKIASIRRFKDDVREVAEGFECGIKIENFTDIKAGDVIECFERIEIAKAVI